MEENNKFYVDYFGFLKEKIDISFKFGKITPFQYFDENKSDRCGHFLCAESIQRFMLPAR